MWLILVLVAIYSVVFLSFIYACDLVLGVGVKK